MSTLLRNSTRLWSVHDAVRLVSPTAMESAASAVNLTTPVIDPLRAAETNLAQILAVVSVCHILALACVFIRIYIRAIVVRSPGMDDMCIAIAILCASGGWVGFLIQAQHGLGRHQETVSNDDMVVFTHVSFSQAIVSATCAMAFLKLSIGFNLLRLSTSKWYIWSLRGAMTVVVCYSIMSLMTFFFHCKPLAGNWDPSLQPQCYSKDLFMTFGLVNTGFNLVTDVLFATFPVFIIWPLRMKKGLRIYLICILSLGYFAVALGVVKGIYQACFIKEVDRTFRLSVTFWGFLELNVGIIAACAVTLKPLLNIVLGLPATNHYHPHNGSAIPLMHRRQRSLHINLHPHPETNWTGPKHPQDNSSLELGQLDGTKKHMYEGTHTPKKPSTASSTYTSSSKQSLFSFYEDLDKRFPWDNLESHNDSLTILTPPPRPAIPPIPPRSPLRTPVGMPPPLRLSRSQGQGQNHNRGHSHTRSVSFTCRTAASMTAARRGASAREGAGERANPECGNGGETGGGVTIPTGAAVRGRAGSGGIATTTEVKTSSVRASLLSAAGFGPRDGKWF